MTVLTLDFTEPPAGRSKRKARIVGDLAYVPLTKGLEAVIDAKDAHIANQYNWHAGKRGRTYYAATSVTLEGGKRAMIYLHRAIMGDQAAGLEVDHIDGNGLNNTRANLREASHAENLRNMRIKKNNKSGARGVHFAKKPGKWVAQITFAGKAKHLGAFEDIEAAKDAYQKASEKLHGTFGVNGSHESCDFCSDDRAELRLLQFDGWTADSNTCRECFTYPDLEFTDLPVVQEAKYHA